jgi:glyoxylase-like metal-dependent hydrolase (beta-lactamase superfamily II)
MKEMRRLLYSVEGNGQMLDGGAMFGNAPKPLWERWAPADDRNRIELACRCLLVREPRRRILFETGIGAFFDPKMKDRFGVKTSEHMLLSNLDKMGLSDNDVDVVVLSHLHFDHAGGLLSGWQESKPYELLFPRATYVVGEKAWKRATDPHPRDKASFIPELHDLLLSSGRLEIVKGTQSDTLGEDFKLHFSDGHTPGLMMTEIPGSNGPVLYASDLIPGRPWVHRSITMGYDRYPELLIDEKQALLTDLCKRNGRIFFTHDPICAMARVLLDERGRFGSHDDHTSLHSFTA